jgi:GNAT superfamily N-acetyltransferase
VTGPVAARRIRPDEGALLKQVRLAALADSPAAFSTRVEDEVGFDDAVWDERAARGARDEGDGTGTFVLDAGAGADRPVGIAVGHRPGPDPSRVELVSMWVDPSVRGTGAGRQLVDAVAGWAAERGAIALDLWVMRGNGGAKAFYERLGFTTTDEIEVADDDPCRDEVRMTRPVQPA